MKKKNKLSNIVTICLYILLFAFFGSIFFIHYFENKLGPGLITVAENEIERLTIIVMNNCIRKYTELDTNLEDILMISRTDQNEIEFIRYNTKKVNAMTASITQMLERDLNHMVKGDFEKIDLNLNNISDAYYTKINDGIIFSISMGTATGNSLLANLGPKIPLNLSLVEDATASVNTKITEYGINNAMIEVVVDLKASTVVHMPFLTKKVTVKNTIPITMEIIQGKIPSYYLGNNLET